MFSGQGGYGTSWSDPAYYRMLSDAKATSNLLLRLQKMAECERHLLRAMPILPLCHDVQPKLRKPFVKGLGSNLLNREQPKYAWIDTNWRPNGPALAELIRLEERSSPCWTPRTLPNRRCRGEA